MGWPGEVRQGMALFTLPDGSGGKPSTTAFDTQKESKYASSYQKSGSH
jgi:hypothetical protein